LFLRSNQRQELVSGVARGIGDSLSFSSAAEKREQMEQGVYMVNNDSSDENSVGINFRNETQEGEGGERRAEEQEDPLMD